MEIDDITNEIMDRLAKRKRRTKRRKPKILKTESTVDESTIKESTRRKLSKKKKGWRNPNFGKERSESTKQKISQAMTGRKLSEEHKKNIAKSMVKRWSRVRQHRVE